MTKQQKSFWNGEKRMAGKPRKRIDYAGWSVDIFSNDTKIDKLSEIHGSKIKKLTIIRSDCKKQVNLFFILSVCIKFAKI